MIFFFLKNKILVFALAVSLRIFIFSRPERDSDDTYKIVS